MAVVARLESGAVRFGLSGDQRVQFVGRAALCGAVGLVSTLALLPWGAHRPAADDLWFLGSLGCVAYALAVYHLRVAYGWVVADGSGLTTSRLIRGRSVRWHDIQEIDKRWYSGMGGGITVVRIRTVTGRAFLLPAPRTTASWDREFNRAVSYLLARWSSSTPSRGAPRQRRDTRRRRGTSYRRVPRRIN